MLLFASLLKDEVLGANYGIAVKARKRAHANTYQRSCQWTVACGHAWCGSGSMTETNAVGEDNAGESTLPYSDSVVVRKVETRVPQESQNGYAWEFAQPPKASIHGMISRMLLRIILKHSGAPVNDCAGTFSFHECYTQHSPSY